MGGSKNGSKDISKDLAEAIKQTDLKDQYRSFKLKQRIFFTINYKMTTFHAGDCFIFEETLTKVINSNGEEEIYERADDNE